MWERSTYVNKLDPALNEACRSRTGCRRPTSVENVYLLAGISPPGVRRATTSRQERRKQTEDPMHSIYKHEPVNNRMTSRNRTLDTNHPAERLRAWTQNLRSVPQKLRSIPSEDLGLGSDAPWLHWKCLNRPRTGMVRCKSNMLKWKYSDADTIMLLWGADTDYGPSAKEFYAASGMYD